MYAKGFVFQDFSVPWVERFAKPPTLSDSIDQLFYASTYNLSILAVGNRRFSEIRVNSLQLQVCISVRNLSHDNIFFSWSTTSRTTS